MLELLLMVLCYNTAEYFKLVEICLVPAEKDPRYSYWPFLVLPLCKGSYSLYLTIEITQLTLVCSNTKFLLLLQDLAELVLLESRLFCCCVIHELCSLFFFLFSITLSSCPGRIFHKILRF